MYAIGVTLGFALSTAFQLLPIILMVAGIKALFF